MSSTLHHSINFCSWIAVPSHIGLSNGARVKATSSHKDGWEQELMCRQQSQRCQGMSLLFEEAEEQDGQDVMTRTGCSIILK